MTRLRRAFLPSVPKYQGSEDTADPSWLWKGSVPALNGLRAVSILLVLAGHLSLQKESLLRCLPNTGYLGVQMFFVISGFLITLLLMRERRHTQGISLRLFYLRRMLRILPAYWAFLLGVVVFQCLGLTNVSARAGSPPRPTPRALCSMGPGTSAIPGPFRSRSIFTLFGPCSSSSLVPGVLCWYRWLM